MQFREVTYRQQLEIQRLVHGPEADITERSLPNMPGTSMREILKHSQHPQNLEQIMLTLRRPANSITRRHFAEVGGELILIQKVTSSEPVVSDFKIAHFGQVMDLPEGMLYPTQDHVTLFETWLRIEMLDALRMMIEENLVRSLLPDMQLKLIDDMLNMAEDPQQPELVQLYSFAVAVAALKRFHAARAAAVAGSFVAKAVAFLTAVLDGPHAADSIYTRDPFEQLKALALAVEGLYLAALTQGQGDYSLIPAEDSSGAKANGSAAAVDPDTEQSPESIVSSARTAGATLESMQRSLEGISALAESHAAPLLSRAVERLWRLLQDREQFEYTPPASLAAKAAGGHGEETSPEEAEEETAEQRELRIAAEEAVARSQVTFDENWHMFLRAVYDTELVPIYAGVSMQLACALLQVLLHKQGADQVPLPAVEVLQQLKAYRKNPLLSASSCILEDMSTQATAGGSSSVGSHPAIMLLRGHAEVEMSTLAKSCCCCNTAEGGRAKMLRCGQCGCVYYCSANCQKADWKLGHKGVCKDLSSWRAQHVAAAHS